MISASILSADFFNLRDIIEKINQSKYIEYIHLDIMDGAFVENISFGFDISEKIISHVSKKIDTHLMVSNPIQQAKKFAKFSDILTIHYEAISKNEFSEFLNICKSNNCKAGLAIKPSSFFDSFKDLIHEVDSLTIMTVEPGAGGQLFIQSQLEKIHIIYDYISKNNMNKIIEIDGGVNESNIKHLNDLGIIDIFVVGGFFIKNTKGNDFDDILSKLLT